MSMSGFRVHERDLPLEPDADTTSRRSPADDVRAAGQARSRDERGRDAQSRHTVRTRSGRRVAYCGRSSGVRSLLPSSMMMKLGSRRTSGPGCRDCIRDERVGVVGGHPTDASVRMLACRFRQPAWLLQGHGRGLAPIRRRSGKGSRAVLFGTDHRQVTKWTRLRGSSSGPRVLGWVRGPGRDERFAAGIGRITVPRPLPTPAPVDRRQRGTEFWPANGEADAPTMDLNGARSWYGVLIHRLTHGDRGWPTRCKGCHVDNLTTGRRENLGRPRQLLRAEHRRLGAGEGDGGERPQVIYHFAFHVLVPRSVENPPARPRQHRRIRQPPPGGASRGPEADRVRSSGFCTEIPTTPVKKRLRLIRHSVRRRQARVRAIPQFYRRHTAPYTVLPLRRNLRTRPGHRSPWRLHRN